MTTTPVLATKASTSVAVPSGKEWQERLGSALAALDEWSTKRASDGIKPTAEVRRDLPSILETMEIACRPLGERDFAVAFVGFLETAIALGVKSAGSTKQEAAAQLGIYSDALADLPGDLVVWALKAVWREWRYPSLPKPGDVRDLIREKASRRRTALQFAKWAKRLSSKFNLPVGLMAAAEIVKADGPRVLSPETQAMLDEAKKRKPAAAFTLKPAVRERETRSGDLMIEPRPDLVRKWAMEMGVPLD